MHRPESSLEPVLGLQSSDTVEITPVPRDEGQIPVHRHSREPQVLEGHVLAGPNQRRQDVSGDDGILFREGQHAKPLQYVALNPSPQGSGFGRPSRAEAELEDGNGTNTQVGGLGFPVQPSHHLGVGSALDQLAHDIGVEEEHVGLGQRSLTMWGGNTTERADFFEGREKRIVGVDNLGRLVGGSDCWRRTQHGPQGVFDKGLQRLAFLAGALFRQAEELLIDVDDGLHAAKLRLASGHVNRRGRRAMVSRLQPYCVHEIPPFPNPTLMKPTRRLLIRLALLLGATTLLFSAWAQNQATLTPIGKWPEYPMPLVRETPCMGMAVVGSHAYLAGPASGGLRLATLDVTTPSQPRYLSQLDAQIAIENFPQQVLIRVRGNYAYILVTQSVSQLVVVDVSDPVAARLAGSCPLSGTLLGMDVVGTRIYVAAMEGVGSVRVINASDPAQPFVETSVAFPGFPACVSGAGNYV